MAGTTTVPIVNQTGVVSTPAVNIPNAATGGSIVITGPSVTDPTVRISITFDFSPDGGATWATTSPGPATNPYPLIGTAVGGPTDPRGRPLTQFNITAAFPPGTNRQVRAILVFDGNPFNGQAALSWT